MSSEPPWSSEDPYLSGNFAPVMDELDLSDLAVKGKIPPDLSGVYMRNGPNPQFKPISYTYPFDGDGMIHALDFHEGKARYRNRFVETKGLLAERRAGRALYGGILHPVMPDPAAVGPDGDPGPFKNGAFIHIIRHAGTYLALYEADSAYEMSAELKTKGLWCPGGPEPLPVNAHTRWDPKTGERYFITYDVQPPYLRVFVFDARGRLTQSIPVEKSHPTMIHDFVLTENFVVFFDCPVVFDPAAPDKGGNILQWRPELGVKIGLLPRRGGTSKPRWLPTDPFFVFHFANAFERDGKVIVDYVRHGALSFGIPVQGEHPPVFYRSLIEVESGNIQHEQRDDRVIEFPRIREDLDARPARYAYVPGYAGSPETRRGFQVLVKYDTEAGKSVIRDFGPSYQIGEAVFAPKPGRSDEDDGYLMLFAYDTERRLSEFYLLDARDPAGEPVAIIPMPRRVPHGLHGSWIPGESLG